MLGTTGNPGDAGEPSLFPADTHFAGLSYRQDRLEQRIEALERGLGALSNTLAGTLQELSQLNAAAAGNAFKAAQAFAAALPPGFSPSQVEGT